MPTEAISSVGNFLKDHKFKKKRLKKDHIFPKKKTKKDQCEEKKKTTSA